MVRVCLILAALLATADSARVNVDAKQTQVSSDCVCSETGTVTGPAGTVSTGKAGCAMHFGQRFNYVCYVDAMTESECPGSRMSSRLGVYWRSCRSEHVVDEAKQFLMEAMENMDMDALESTITVAKARGVDQETLDAAEVRVGVVTEMMAARDELFAAIKGYDVGRLQEALEETERLELDEFIPDRTLDDASERLEFLNQRFDAESELRAAMAATDVAKLRTCIENVAIFHSSQELLEQAANRLNVLLAEIAAAKAALTEAMRGIDSGLLESAFTEAGRLLVDQETMTAANNRLDALYLSQTAEEDLLQAVQGSDLDVLAAMLAEAQEVGIGIEASVAVGEARVAVLEKVRLEEMQRITAELLEAADGDSMGHLQDLLQRGRQFGLDASVLRAGEEGANRLRSRMAGAQWKMVQLTNSGANGNELQAVIDEVRLLHAASQQEINAAQRKLDQLRR